MPAVGIVMPTHGTNPHLGAAVESVVAQTLGDWRLCIVCDGAGAATERQADELAARDPRIRVARQQRAGVAAARNRGLAEIGRDVELVTWLDHDDRWLPGTLARLARAAGTAPEPFVGAHGIGRFIDESGALIRAGEMEDMLRRRRGVERGRLVEWPVGRPTGFANLAFGNCIPVGTALVKRGALDRVGAFDERAVPADDYDMWLRLSRLGDFAFVDEVVMEYRQHPQPTWTRPRGIGRGATYVRRRVITSRDNTPEQARLARQGFRLAERRIARGAMAASAELATHGRPGAAARELARAAIHLSGYVVGRPGPWHG